MLPKSAKEELRELKVEELKKRELELNPVKEEIPKKELKVVIKKKKF